METWTRAAARINPRLRDTLSFTFQVLLVGAIQMSNDIFRGNISPPDASVALRHAHDIVAFEQTHNFYVEPGIQIWAIHVKALGGLLSWSTIVPFANLLYAFGHLAVPLAVALWVFLRHRNLFPTLRNILIATNVFAFVGYEVYPLAPPRLTPGLIWNHHAFQFQDTMRHVIGTGTLNGTPIGYNPYSAMPSLHIAWAIVAAVCIIVLSRHTLLRLAAACYPALMLFAVVVTGNHYIMDGLGAAICVAAAAMVVFGARSAFLWRNRQTVPQSVPVARDLSEA